MFKGIGRVFNLLVLSLPLLYSSNAFSDDHLGDQATVPKNYLLVTESIFTNINKAFSLYQDNNKKEAIVLIQETYFDYFEDSGMENAVAAHDSSLKLDLEAHFTKLSSMLKSGESIVSLNEELKAMRASFSKANDFFISKENFTSLFLKSLLLIVREGFEALLIVTAIIAYLVKSGNAKKVGLVYSAITIAVLLSFVTAIVLHIVFGEAEGVNREILEGITALVASAMLLYVSYWLISNATSKKWIEYIKQQVKTSLDKNSKRALWFTVFLAVYREGAEVVLFYQALGKNVVDNSGYFAITGGFVLGVVLLVIIYFVMKVTAIRLPIKPFFLVTGIFIYLMSLMFIGQGIMEFAEGKLFIPTAINALPMIPSIGLYPYFETVIPQLFILGFGLWGTVILINRGKKQY